jgi:hypothetical protein
MGWRNRFSGVRENKPVGFGRRTVGWNNEDELVTLQQQARTIEAELNQLHARIDQLKSAPKDQ